MVRTRELKAHGFGSKCYAGLPASPIVIPFLSHLVRAIFRRYKALAEDRMRKPFSRVLPAIMVTFAWCLWTSGQAQRLPSSVKVSKETFASCYEPVTGKLVGSQLLRTPEFLSPNGRYSAYAENEAVAFKSGNSSDSSRPECENTSRLFVADGKGKTFRQVLLLKAAPETLGNSIGLVDWSPNGRSLLLEQGVFQWGSDAGATFVRIYDADDGVFSNQEFVQGVFNKYHEGKNCTAIIRAVGFSQDGNVVFSAQPYFDVGEDTPRRDSCVERKGLWLLNRTEQTVSPLPDEYKVRRYGKYAGRSRR
jgi:hypothetical protein